MPMTFWQGNSLYIALALNLQFVSFAFSRNKTTPDDRRIGALEPQLEFTNGRSLLYFSSFYYRSRKQPSHTLVVLILPM